MSVMARKPFWRQERKKYDFILMDIHMPEMDGFEATKYIRTAKNPNKDTPIFALTADVSAKDNQSYRHLFNGFMLKPLEVEKLFQILSTYIGNVEHRT